MEVSTEYNGSNSDWLEGRVVKRSRDMEDSNRVVWKPVPITDGMPTILRMGDEDALQR
jgi:hypothetical protein